MSTTPMIISARLMRQTLAQKSAVPLVHAPRHTPAPQGRGESFERQGNTTNGQLQRQQRLFSRPYQLLLPTSRYGASWSFARFNVLYLLTRIPAAHHSP